MYRPRRRPRPHHKTGRTRLKRICSGRAGAWPRTSSVKTGAWCVAARIARGSGAQAGKPSTAAGAVGRSLGARGGCRVARYAAGRVSGGAASTCSGRIRGDCGGSFLMLGEFWRLEQSRRTIWSTGALPVAERSAKDVTDELLPVSAILRPGLPSRESLSRVAQYDDARLIARCLAAKVPVNSLQVIEVPRRGIDLIGLYRDGLE